MCFNTKFYNIDVPIFGGRRTIVDVKLWHQKLRYFLVDIK
jgi:hypothetical protein